MSATIVLPTTASTADTVAVTSAPEDPPAATASDVDYDGDSESVVPRNVSSDDSENAQPRTPVTKKKRGTIGMERKPLEDASAAEEASSLSRLEKISNQSEDSLCDNKSLAPSPVSSRTSSTTTASSPSSSKSKSSSPSRNSFSAAVQVSTLQASFAEKTAAEMQEIIGWYSQYEEQERFTKVDQRQSLPHNAMVVDDESDDDEGDEEEAVDQDSTSNAAFNDAMSPTPSKKRRSPGSSSKSSHRTDQVREHLEASDHLIRITQYMAEVITELEHSSSSSGNEEGDNTDRMKSLDSKEVASQEGDDTSSMDDETLRRIAQETAILREEYEKRIKSQQRKPPVKVKSDFGIAVMIMWIFPVVVAIILGWLWKSRTIVELGKYR